MKFILASLRILILKMFGEHVLTSPVNGLRPTVGLNPSLKIWEFCPFWRVKRLNSQFHLEFSCQSTTKCKFNKVND